MKRKSDLSPPLGFPGGPCYVADRARGLSNFRRIQEELERKGELSSALEKKVYPRRHLQKGKGKSQSFSLFPCSVSYGFEKHNGSSFAEGICFF